MGRIGPLRCFDPAYQPKLHADLLGAWQLFEEGLQVIKLLIRAHGQLSNPVEQGFILDSHLVLWLAVQVVKVVEDAQLQLVQRLEVV